MGRQAARDRACDKRASAPRQIRVRIAALPTLRLARLHLSRLAHLPRAPRPRALAHVAACSARRLFRSARAAPASAPAAGLLPCSSIAGGAQKWIDGWKSGDAAAPAAPPAAAPAEAKKAPFSFPSFPFKKKDAKAPAEKTEPKAAPVGAWPPAGAKMEAVPAKKKAAPAAPAAGASDADANAKNAQAWIDAWKSSEK